MRRPTRSEPVIAAPEMRIARWLTDTCVDVIYLFQMAAANVNAVDVVLAMCGVEDEDTRGDIIAWEGFETLEDLGILEDDKDVIEMAKRMASRNQNQGRVILSTVTIKRLQALIWWIRDRQKLNLPLNAAEFTPAVLADAVERKIIQRKQADAEITTRDLAKFEPDDFDTHEDAFLNLLAQTYGVLNEPIRYVVRPGVAPNEFANAEEERMYRIPLVGTAFDSDNRAVYRKLKAFLINTPGWAWIEPFNATEDGRQAFRAWSDHYNGEGELSKRTALAKQRLDQLHYRNEKSMTFERYTELLTKCFQTLHKDVDQRYSDRQKVEKFLKGITTQEPELSGAKAVIDMRYPRDFTGACAYFSTQVARVHGPAVLEGKQRGRKRSIYSTQSGRGGRGRGRGRFGGRGDGRGRGRYGGRDGGRNPGRGTQRTIINGVDVSDPTRSFTADEWESLGPHGGRAYVTQRREAMAGRGRSGDGRGGREGRGRGVRFNIAAIQSESDEAKQDQDENNSARGSERGGRNGRGFGRGAYGDRS